jgi:transcriptional regulator with XRE-family HTH domain
MNPTAAPAVPTTEDPDLGECLRELRTRRHLSLAQVSALCGISKSTLSRVESGQLSLTYDKLLRLCRGLQIDLVTLLGNGQRDTRALGRRTATPAGGGRPVKVNMQEYKYLCTELAGKKMTPMSGVIWSRTLAESNGLLKHEGEEFTFVLEGTLELHTEFYEPLAVEAGGSVYFDSTMGHAYLSKGTQPLKIICVCSTPEPALEQAIGAVSAEPAQPELRPPAPRSRKPSR